MASPVTHAVLVLAILTSSAIGVADPAAFIPTQTTPDPVPRSHQPPPILHPTWDLDGLYLWLGAVGAAGDEAAHWDSTFGGDAAVVRVRERARLGAVGATFGASKWTTHDGGRLWLDGLAGTELLGHMIGVSAGPLLELDQLARPRIGGSIGLWGFAGVAPYARVGAIDSLGAFVEIGLHITLPVLRH